MSVTALIALAILVMLAGGFYAGRARAIQAVEGNTVRLHSLPNYHGYYVAIWTGLPALLLLLAHGMFADKVVENLTYAELRREASSLNVQLNDAIEADGAYESLRTEAVQLRGRAEAISADIQRLRNATGEDRDPELMDRLEAERLDALNAVTAADEAVLEREGELIARVAAEARAEGAPVRALAGFEVSQAPREQRQLFLADTLNIARGELPSRESRELVAAASIATRHQNQLRFLIGGMALVVALAGLARTRSQVEPAFRARNHVESLVTALLFLSSVIAILTTVGIVFSLLFESLRFFSSVPVSEFLFGLQWSPQIALRADQVGQSGAFGAVPLFAGTGLITLIAMVVAIPIGLLSAIYLSEYAGPRFRATAKPLLEILAGIPTVVYGFFALLVVAPAIRGLFTWLGFDDVATQSALSAGLVMGIMIIPFISSLSDDVINSVPQALRDGSYAMGATRSETISHVVLPAALPGIVGAILLGVSRAVGETMIVVMAAGQSANLTANPLESVTTITVQIVMLLTGDQEFDSPKTLSAFALGLVLFVITLIMNVVALRVVQRYREKYD
ncbi:MAG: phosphate ABC transporter permease subunit PstC [Alphaproteobacteria bacterium]|jgi:phosphate transport system permease protein|uniref:phosphate ABC transporter permease subunit PstC n=1 Tax=Maricaulis alexandrii TaxID=2570354 RepID=UPI0011082DFD|nr:phosphate ABC transporter permease subunit PstC [Maricaulis alexandrii]MCR9266602.1 phosphate ABC transporter permease subunit PstC [Alphaproteobacteria bacterium]